MKRTAPAKKQAGLMMACIALTVLLFYSITLILPAKCSQGTKLLEKTLDVMEQIESYNLIILEKAPGYELSFRGRVEKSEMLSGMLPDYGLEVLSKESLLLVKQEGASEWDKAEKLGLQGLAGFIINPLELLQDQKGCFGGAIMGETVVIGENLCQTVCFTVPDREELVRQLFPRVDCDAVDEVIIGAAVEEEGSILRQLRLLVEFGEISNKKIERCYYIEP